MTITLPDIALEIRRRREDAGLTQRQLAVLVQCSDTTIGKIEAGCVPQRGTMVIRLRRALSQVEEQAA